MTYGGGVLEYFVNQGSLVNVSVRGLVGGGSANLERSFELRPFDSFPGNAPAFSRRPGRDAGFARSFSVGSSFFVAEPEVDVMLNVTEAIRLSFGGGYRFIGGAAGLNERLDGFTANPSLKLSFF